MRAAITALLATLAMGCGERPEQLGKQQQPLSPDLVISAVYARRRRA